MPVNEDNATSLAPSWYTNLVAQGGPNTLSNENRNNQAKNYNKPNKQQELNIQEGT